MKARIRVQMQSLKYRQLIPYFLFFILRLASFCIHRYKIFPNKISLKNSLKACETHNERIQFFNENVCRCTSICKSDKIDKGTMKNDHFSGNLNKLICQDNFLAIEDDFLYLFQFNWLQLFLILHAHIKPESFNLDVAIASMLHNAFLCLFFTFNTIGKSYYRNREYLVIQAFGFIIEAIYSLVQKHKNRINNNVNIFKFLGADNTMNAALYVKQCLNTTNVLNTFLGIVISFKFFLPPKIYHEKPSRRGLIITVLTLLQNTFVTINSKREDYVLRYIAIFLTILKIPVSLISIFKSMKFIDRKIMPYTQVYLILFTDSILISVAMVYFLFIDLKNFKLGLNEKLRLRTKPIFLSNRFTS